MAVQTLHINRRKLRKESCCEAQHKGPFKSEVKNDQKTYNDDDDKEQEAGDQR